MTSDAHDFVHTFFKKGAEFTEELLKDNERLRSRTVDLEHENAELRTQLASDEAARELLKKIQQLEKDKHELLSRIHEAGVSSSRFSTRFAEVEEELAQLANLYIASYQLHSSLTGRTWCATCASCSPSSSAPAPSPCTSTTIRSSSPRRSSTTAVTPTRTSRSVARRRSPA